MNNYVILLPILILSVLFLIYLIKSKTKQKYKIVENKLQLRFQNNHPTRSFSSEQQFTDPRQKYLANSTKCFSCEKEFGYKGQPTKCFSCEEPSYSLTKLN